jgi:hypothetical protein
VPAALPAGVMQPIVWGLALLVFAGGFMMVTTIPRMHG